jgi:hypothetical protein
MNDGKYLLTNADKVGNTPAWQNRYKVNESTGEMLYEMADHLKESYEEELIAKIDATLEELRRLDEGKIPAGLQAYLDKKKGKKGNGDKKEEENGNGKDHGNGNGSKGSKPDFLDLDKDGDKKEPMKKAAKEKKEETEYNYVNGYLNELKKTTMGSYIAKASKDLADRRFDQGDSEKRKYDPDEADEKEDKKLDKREQGIARAAKKITKENVDALIKSGFFNEEEITGILWGEFEENRQVAMNPEKYKDPDESDKPYRQRSKAARMRDPERGINSPAFKKFMADRGM